VNEAKLANFQEIDIFVNISCPFSSMLDTQGFVKEMVTPLEVELALNPDKEWSGHYTTSFGDVLQCPLQDNLDESAREQSPRYSLARRCVVGRSKPDYEEGAEDEAVENLALMKVNDSNSLILQDDASGLVMQSRVQAREYNGLNPAIGETPVERAEMGLSGIARNYKSKN
jgi:diphthamide biosynthesis protein 2